MYIPTINQWTDHDEIVAFMKNFSFATVVSTAPEGPVATHIPVLTWQEDDTIWLSAHFAIANPHAQLIDQGNTLVIFNGPHAYVSPTHYDRELNVPTWNYLAVHAYGTATIVTDPGEIQQLLSDTIDTYEPGYRQQWERLPGQYQTGMTKGIVAFNIRVTALQAKKKISQNKTDEERHRIGTALSTSTDSNVRWVATYMKENNA